MMITNCFTSPLTWSILPDSLTMHIQLHSKAAVFSLGAVPILNEAISDTGEETILSFTCNLVIF